MNTFSTNSPRWIQATATSSRVYLNNSNPGAGQVAYDQSYGGLKVFDGSTWVPLDAFTMVSLTSEAEELLEWVNKKRAEEVELNSLAERHPLVKDLRDQLQVAITMVKEHDGN